MLKGFLETFRALGRDLFLKEHPGAFLVEEGRLEFERVAASTRRAFCLEPGNSPVVVGRKEPADLRILDKNISGTHAHMIPPSAPGGAWSLMDMASTNGSYVDGEKVQPGQPYALKTRSLLAFGPLSKYVYLDAEAFCSLLEIMDAARGRERETEPHDKAILAQMALDDLTETSAHEPAEQRAGVFLLCDSIDPVAIEPGEAVVLGRSPAEADVVLAHHQVSRKHAQIEYREDGIYLQDLKSSNGVMLGGVRIGGNPIELRVGMTITIGAFRLKLAGQLSKQMDTDTAVVAPSVVEARKALIKGSLSKMPLRKLLAAIETKHKTGELTVESSTMTGRVAFRVGMPWSAATSDGLKDIEAIRALLALTEGSFSIDPGAKVEGDRQIDVAFGGILLEM